jgi:hypothetical protein
MLPKDQNAQLISGGASSLLSLKKLDLTGGPGIAKILKVYTHNT